jgi:Ferritin-like domain
MGMEHVHVEVTPEARVEAASGTRQMMLVRALAVGGTLVVSGVVVAGLPGIARSATSPGRDLEILDFALQLEYLQKAFYDGAVASPAITGALKDFATVVAGHEGEHVQYLQAALGTNASPAPAFTFGDTFASNDAFAAAAATLEDLGVAAYNGQAANLTPKSLAAAAEVVSVDARHAAWIRSIVGKPPADDATDDPMTAEQVTASLQQTGYLG